MKKPSKIVIAGAGIIGTSFAYHLAKAGAQVVIIEKGEPAQGATANSFAWINASRGKMPHHYYLLNLLGISAWRQLDQSLNGALAVSWNGRVEWESAVQDTQSLFSKINQHQQNGYPLHTITPQKLIEFEPNIVAEADTAVYTPIEGHIDPVHATQTLLSHAQAVGAELHTNCELMGIKQNNGKIQAVQTTSGVFEADKLVIACGVGSPKVAKLAGLDVPLQDSPGVLAHSAPMPSLLNGIVLSPHGHMKQKRDGRIVVGSSFSGTDGTDNSIEAGHKLFNHAAQTLPHLSNATVEKMTLGWRVLPKDERPIIGYAQKAPNVYLAIMHSGITLSPLMGQLAVLEILENSIVNLLQPYRLERF